MLFFLRFIKGFIYRNHPRCPENEYFLDYIRFSFLMNLKRNLPKSVLDKSWPTPPPSLCEVGTATVSPSHWGQSGDHRPQRPEGTLLGRTLHSSVLSPWLLHLQK